jgi:hypothetical protein
VITLLLFLQLLPHSQKPENLTVSRSEFVQSTSAKPVPVRISAPARISAQEMTRARAECRKQSERARKEIKCAKFRQGKK